MKKILEKEWVKKILICVVVGFGLLIADIGCIFRQHTHIPCPGCGMTRAIMAFLQGDIQEAFRYHPLFWLVPSVAIIFIFADTTNSRKFEILLTACLGLFVVVYFIRLFTNSIP